MLCAMPVACEGCTIRTSKTPMLIAECRMLPAKPALRRSAGVSQLLAQEPIMCDTVVCASNAWAVCRFQLRCVLQQPLAVQAGATVTGELRLVAHERQSYDIHVTLQAPGLQADAPAQAVSVAGSHPLVCWACASQLPSSTQQQTIRRLYRAGRHQHAWQVAWECAGVVGLCMCFSAWSQGLSML